MQTSSLIGRMRDRYLALVTFENLSIFSLIAMSIGVLYTNYAGFVYSEIISFLVQDGWCEPKSQGIGVHCFGDFYAPTTISSMSNPWSDPLNLAYTPLSFSYFNLIASDYVASLSPKLPLFVNLIFAIFALGFPGFHIILQKAKSGLSGKWVLVVLLTSTPSLMMIDRGSNNFLLVPLLYFYYLKIREKDLIQSFALLVAMSLWKPQMILFGLLFLTQFGLKKFSFAVFTTVSTLFLSFVLYPKSLIASILDWIGNSREYQTYAPSPSFGNFSFASFTGLLESLVSKLSNPSKSFSMNENLLSTNEVSLISLVFGFVAFGTLFLVRNRIGINYQFLAVTAFFLQLPGTTFGYYMVLLIIPLIFIIRDNEFEEASSQFQKWIYVLYGFLLFAMVPAWPIGLGVLKIDSAGIFVNIGINWAVAHVLLSLLSLLLIVDFSHKSLKLVKMRVFSSD
jgi:hypothetical protein